MKKIATTELSAYIGERVCVAGWLHLLRQMGGVTFLVLRDGWGQVQAVAETEDELLPLRAEECGLESVVRIEGLVVQEAQAPGGIELHALRIEVVSAVTQPPVVSLHKRKINANISTLLDHAVVVNRHPARRAILRLFAGTLSGFRAALVEQGFTEIQTPKIVGASTESGANVFELDYFGQPAYLAQSPQFYKQIMVGVFERVFEVGPVFRAEEHDSSRHLNEYVSLDAEMGFIEDHFSIMLLLRDVLARILATLSQQYPAELKLLQVEMPLLPAQIPHIHFTEAQEIILKHYHSDIRQEPDLSPQDERCLGAWARQEYQSDFLFVTGYPMRKRPFYTHPDPQRAGYSNSFDLLFRGTELVTGGQRLHRYEDYLAALDKAGLPQAAFAYYLDAFKYGMPPHGGFGMGSERLLMQLLGLPNVKLAATFPRDIHRLIP